MIRGHRDQRDQEKTLATKDTTPTNLLSSLSTSSTLIPDVRESSFQGFARQLVVLARDCEKQFEITLQIFKRYGAAC